jgi:hypothetical protein
MMMKGMIRWKPTLGTVAILFFVGCAGIGPKTIPRDRFDYASAISNSWKRQMLLNMVKIRYADIPVFVDVASVINQYALEGDVELGASWYDSIPGDSQNVGVTGRYRDQPTITYLPLMGKAFAESLVKPIPPPAIFFLIQTGVRVDYVFRTCVQTVNGIHNRRGRHSMKREADPEFYRLISLLYKVQQSGAVGMRLERTKDEREATVFNFHQKNISPEIVSAINSIKRMLGLAPDIREFKVVYGSIAREENEIVMLSRSMLEIILELASYVEVPETHLTEGRTYESFLGQMDVSAEFGPLITIDSDRSKPTDDFIAIRYKDYWFWIDDRDSRSKRTFAFLWLLFSFTESEKAYAPVVTIPTG